jgi:hypothetical protein
MHGLDEHVLGPQTRRLIRRGIAGVPDWPPTFDARLQ